MKNKKTVVSNKEIETIDKIHEILSKGKYDKVIEMSIKAKKEFPNQILFYIVHSIANSQKGNSDEALKLLFHALTIFPNDYELFFQIAKVFEDMDQYDKAEEYFMKSFTATPKENHEAKSDCMNDIGALKYNQGKEDEANKYWEKALEINPDNNRAKSNLHELFEEEGEDKDDDLEEGFYDSLQEDFELFQYIQQRIYLKGHNRKKFKSEEEEEKMNRHILAAWTNKIVGQMDLMESLNEDQKSEWYNSIEIDFSGPPPEVEIPEIDHPIYKEMSKKFSFLPSNGVSYLMLVYPFLEAVGITEEDIEDFVYEDEISEEDKSKYKWAYKIGEKFFKLSDSKSESELQKSFDEILDIASERISKKKAEKILMKIMNEMMEGKMPSRKG